MKNPEPLTIAKSILDNCNTNTRDDDLALQMGILAALISIADALEQRNRWV